MNCFICQQPMSHYFKKTFDSFGLAQASYLRCGRCGFVASKTHSDMSDTEWESLNEHFHTDPEIMLDNPANRNPPYAEQADMLYRMRHALLLAHDAPWLDWGAGSAQLSDALQRKHDIQLLNYDRFLPATRAAIRHDQITPRSYGLVVSSAVFEHVRSRENLDEIERCVAADGALAVHTLVRGTIPPDPKWFYLLPVHCAFHTNRSMQLLMEQWNFDCSVYNEHAKLWVMFRRATPVLRARIDSINAAMGYEYLHFKHGFMDFWP